jgi:ABC-2 type transport system permease protein
MIAQARWWWDASLVQIRVTILDTLQYPFNMLIWLIGAVLEPLMMLIVWSVVAEQSGGQIDGMTQGDFAAYYLVALFVSRFTFNWLNWEYEELVRNGTMAARLMRPVPVYLLEVMNNVGYKIISNLIVFSVVLLLGVVFQANFNPPLWSLLAAIPVILLAFFVRFTLEWGVALCAFWVTRMRAINNLYYTMFLLFSGMLAPLTFYPPMVQTISYFLPWRWLIYFPVQVILGVLTPQDVLNGVAWQLGWLLAISLVVLLFWRASIRRFSAVGS